MVLRRVPVRPRCQECAPAARRGPSFIRKPQQVAEIRWYLGASLRAVAMPLGRNLADGLPVIAAAERYRAGQRLRSIPPHEMRFFSNLRGDSELLG